MRALSDFPRFAMIPAVILLLGALGMMGKTTIDIEAPLAVQPALLDHEMQRRGLVQTDAVKLSLEGVYILRRFMRPPCDGALFVVLLQRNAEGARLLSNALPGMPVRYWLDGQGYRDFPTARYWMARLAYAAQRSVSSAAEPPLLFAYAEYGPCALAPEGASD